MPNKGLKILIVLVLICVIIVRTAHSQMEPQNPKVDADFESLSITEQISQLLLVDIRNTKSGFNDLPLSFGGILLSEPAPYKHLVKTQQLRKYGLADVLIASEISETGSLVLDSLKALGSTAIFENVQEPYLFYETGVAVAKQARLLGIHFLLDTEKHLSFDNNQNRNYWKKAEFFQGLIASDVLPPETFQIIEFSKFSISKLLNAPKPTMILLQPENIPDFHERIQEAISADSLQLDQLEGMIKYILNVKQSKKREVLDIKYNLNQLQHFNYDYLNFELGKASVKLLNNANQLIPVKALADKKFASINFNSPDNTFTNFLDKYAGINHFEMNYKASSEELAELWNELINYDLIICSLHKPDHVDQMQQESFRTFLAWLSSSSKCITASFLPKNQLISIPQFNLISAPEDSKIFHEILPQIIFGGIRLESKLNGVNKPEGSRFAYSYPEAVGLNSTTLSHIDSIASLAITERATPGCQVLVAKDNQVVFQKSYGFHTYDSAREVRDDDLYDLASITKVSGALPGLMKLYEEGRFDLDATLGTYLKYFRSGNKKDLTFREILAHQAGLKAWIPYWQTATRKNGKYRWKTLSNTQSENYPYEIADNLYLHKSYKKKIYRQIRKTDLGEKKYLYSGLTFYIFPDIIEEITGQKYEEYIYDNFYKPLGANTLTYRPIEKFDVDRIVPTEYDSLFRKSQIHGKVHDEGAAMMEGISSNAGLFANANDLAKLWQMYCNYGEYGGTQYLKEETVREFARCQYPENDNRRALGFDRPLPEPKLDGNTAVSVSQSSFGHTGFTGTFAWADPEYNLVYIFLSNRVYPTRNNTKLYDLNIRTNIQQVIYDAME
jgi:CubicO group peptidase (beta-lactamase class C family)